MKWRVHAPGVHVLGGAVGVALMAGTGGLMPRAAATDVVADGMRVCIGADRVLRLAERACAKGERAYRLAEWEPEKPEVPDPEGVSEEEVAALSRRLKALEQARDRDPEPRPDARGGVTRVRAPFEVVDAAGRRILAVAEGANDRSAKLFNSKGQVVVDMFAKDDAGGVIQAVLADDRQTYAAMGAFPDNTGMQVRRGGRRLVFAGDGGKGSDESTGYVQVYHDGKPLAVLNAAGGHGFIGIVGASGQRVADLSEYADKPGYGRLVLSDAGGNWTFKAGHEEKGGGACVNRGSGVWCLGINLPLTH